MGCENPRHAGYGWHREDETCSADWAIGEQKYAEDVAAGEAADRPDWPDDDEVRRMERGHQVDEVMHGDACGCVVCEARRQQDEWQTDIEAWAERVHGTPEQPFLVNGPAFGTATDYGFKIMEQPFSQAVFYRPRRVGKATIARSLSEYAASRERRRDAAAKLPRSREVADGADASLFAQRFWADVTLGWPTPGNAVSWTLRLVDLPLDALKLLVGEDFWLAYVEERNAEMRWADDGGPCGD